MPLAWFFWTMLQEADIFFRPKYRVKFSVQAETALQNVLLDETYFALKQ